MWHDGMKGTLGLQRSPSFGINHVLLDLLSRLLNHFRFCFMPEASA